LVDVYANSTPIKPPERDFKWIKLFFKSDQHRYSRTWFILESGEKPYAAIIPDRCIFKRNE